MSLRDRINEDVKAAMRAKDSVRLTALRMLTAAVKQKEVDERVDVQDEHVVAIVEKLIKQRKDSIAAFDQAGRKELADKERFELEVLSQYLPQQASADEVAAEIDAAITAVGASGPQDMGKVMALLKGRLAGRTDLTAVSGKVRQRLAPR